MHYNHTKVIQSIKKIDRDACIPLRSGLWHRFTRRALSLAKSLKGSMTESMASIVEASRKLQMWWREREE